MAFFNITKNIEQLSTHLQAYVDAKLEYFKLKLLKTATELAANVFKRILAAFLFTFFLMMLSVAVAIVIGDELGGMSLGFFIVAGFYLLLLILVWLFGKRLFSTKIIRFLSKKMSSTHEKNIKKQNNIKP